jgi:hypothetical protein
LRILQLWNHSRTSQRFKEPEGSESCLQEPTTNTYPNPDESSAYSSSNFFKIRFNIILRPMPRVLAISFLPASSPIYIYIYIYTHTLPPLWFSGQSSWPQIRRPGFDSRHYQKKKVVGLERGALSLVSTTE